MTASNGTADDLLAFVSKIGPRPAGGRRALVLELGELPGLGDLPPRGGAGERRDHRHQPDKPRVLGEVDLFAAQILVHERAIYIHESTQYYVDRLDWGEKKAYVHQVDVDHYTYANRAVTLKPLDVFAEAPATGGRRIHGEVMVASLVTLFKKLKFITDENVGWGPIDLPELELQTTAYWLTAEALRVAGAGIDLDIALIGAGRATQAVAAVPDGGPAGPGARDAVALTASRRAHHLSVRVHARRGRALGAAVGASR